jgi:hypothetical protein
MQNLRRPETEIKGTRCTTFGGRTHKCHEAKCCTCENPTLHFRVPNAVLVDAINVT